MRQKCSDDLSRGRNDNKIQVMEYDYQELRVPPHEVEAAEARLRADGWEMYRQEGEQWPVEVDTGRLLMQFRRPKKA